LVRIYRGLKLRVDFRIVTPGNWLGAIVSRWYRVTSRSPRIGAGRHSDLVREWRNVFDRSPPRLDRIPIGALKSLIVVVEVRDVVFDHRQEVLTEPNRYSVVGRILGRFEA
jgi:hypothetical protein